MGEEQLYLPYKSVVLFIACGTMVFAIVFIFAKRQITRFALKSNRAPHAAIGANVPKSLKLEIERRLKRVEEIVYEPTLISPFATQQVDYENCHFFFRMKAVDALKILDKELEKFDPGTKRQCGQSLKTFLRDQRQNKQGSLHGIKLEIIDKFADIYEHARHDPTEFKKENYQEFMDLLSHLTEHMTKLYDRGNITDELADSVNHGRHLTPETVKASGSTDHPEASQSVKKPESMVLAPIVPTANTTNNVKVKADDHDSDIEGPGLLEDVHLGYRPHSVNEGESGFLLLKARDSASSQGSLTDTEITFQGIGRDKNGAESYV